MQILTRECPRCGKSFSFETKRGGHRTYCHDCGTTRGKTNPRIPKDCMACGKNFVGGVNQKYCSHDCRVERKRREAEQRRAAALASRTKHCGRCDRTLSRSEFRRDKNRLDGLYCWCNDCTRSYHGSKKHVPSKWNSKAEYDANYRAVNKDRNRDQWFGKYLWTQYRLTEDQYNVMLARQGGRCAICKTKDAGRARGRSNGRFHIDHDHSCCPGRSCGKCVRGLLCNNCNTGIGFLRDDPKLMRAAIRYLNAPPTQDDSNPATQLMMVV